MDFKKWMKEAYSSTSSSGKVSDEWIPPKNELDALIKALDGVAVVNINEPSEGDLERINNTYRKEREKNKILKDALEIIVNGLLPNGHQVHGAVSSYAYDILKELE